MSLFPWIADPFAQGFAPVPDIPVWEWAESGKFTLEKSPEPHYRSSRTPWLRRGADLVRKPWHDGKRIRRFGAKKCSRSGYTEGIFLNNARWIALHEPQNIILSVDSDKQVANIHERLLPTLRQLGDDIFTGKEDDLKTSILKLRGMEIYLSGAGSAGAFSNKTAPKVFNDEVDIYPVVNGEGDTIENFWSRAKGTDEGFQGVISKPSDKDGPIDSFYELGNKERWEVQCPHPGCRKRLHGEWSRVEFQHCKELGGEWDLERVLSETFYRCAHCGQAIYDAHKPAMNGGGIWNPTAKGDPEIVTQHISDIWSMYEDTTLGHLAKAWIRAETKDSRELRMSFQQQHMGEAWEEKIRKVEEADVLKLRRPYRRGTIPKRGCALFLGMDIGLHTNNRWVVYAVNRGGEMWLVDWCHAAQGPQDAVIALRTKSYVCLETGEKQRINFGFIDARYRGEEVYQACLLLHRQLFPVMGKKGFAARSIHWEQVRDKPIGFAQLGFIARDAKWEFYIDRVKDEKPPGLYWPEDTEELLVKEHSNERLIKHKRTGKVIWEEDHGRAIHYGDASLIAFTGIDAMTGGKRSRMMSEVADGEALAAVDFEQPFTAAA